MNRTAGPPTFIRTPIAVVLAWLVPGLGHIFLGQKTRGLICLVAVTLTFWTGVAIGGVGVIDPSRPPRFSNAQPAPPNAPTTGPRAKVSRSWWFFGQVLVGSYTMVAMTASQKVESHNASGAPRYLAWPSGDVAAVYTGVAGLLNLLIILDVWVRAMGLESAAARWGPTGREPDDG